MSSLFEGNNAATASSSSTAAGLASTAIAATVPFAASTETAKYEEHAATDPVSDAKEMESQDEESKNDDSVAEVDDIMQNTLAPQRQLELDLVAEDYSQAMVAFARSPYGRVIRKDYKHEVFMAALDNVINHHIERSNPSEQRIANIKIIMNRFYQVMKIWIAEGMAD